jgi:hypothetical protein
MIKFISDRLFYMPVTDHQGISETDGYGTLLLYYLRNSVRPHPYVCTSPPQPTTRCSAWPTTVPSGPYLVTPPFPAACATRTLEEKDHPSLILPAFHLLE